MVCSVQVNLFSKGAGIMVDIETQNKKSVIAGKTTATESRKKAGEILVKVVDIPKPNEPTKKIDKKAKTAKAISATKEKSTKKGNFS